MIALPLLSEPHRTPAGSAKKADIGSPVRPREALIRRDRRARAHLRFSFSLAHECLATARMGDRYTACRDENGKIRSPAIKTFFITAPRRNGNSPRETARFFLFFLSSSSSSAAAAAAAASSSSSSSSSSSLARQVFRR